LAGLVILLPTISPTVFMHIEERGKSLLLRWKHEGKPYSFSMRGYNNPVGRSQAESKLAEIKTDIIAGYFDPTLLKYRLRKTGKKPTAISAVEVFQKYAEDRLLDRDLSHSSRVRLKGIASKLGQFLGDKPAAQVTESVAKDVIARWSESVSNRTIKGYLFDLRAAWDWARSRYHLAENNPWSNRIPRITVQPVEHDDPLTIAEFQAIITAFKVHNAYSFYAEFVIFISHSACRFGEVAALKWKHLGADFSTAWIEKSISRGHENKKGTKTGRFRTIQLSTTVRSMLVERYKRVNPQPDDLVFPAPKGGFMNDHRFRERQWKTILASCKIEYTRPYNIRHSAISHAVKNGADLTALAEQTGHSKRVLIDTYLHAIDRECLFVDFGGK
jgi:integrase